MQGINFNSSPADRQLQLETAVANGERPSLAVEQGLLDLFEAGKQAILEEQLIPVINQYPNWLTGWNMFCNVLQLQGKDNENALTQVLRLIPEHDGYQPKIFCIGANKTGTTSLEMVFLNLGLTVGDQEPAEMLFHDWVKQDFRRIIKYCHTAQAFQDLPFSLHGTFKVLDDAFPKSRFILTIRNNADQWYQSLLRFHSNMIGKNRVPTIDDLREFNYRYPGFVLDVLKYSYGAEKSTLYHKETYQKYYEDHNSQVKKHFKGRPDDLLVLNVSEPDAMERLMKFLGYPYTGQKMLHLNSLG